MYSPLWKITHQNSSVLCTPPFENSLFLVGAYFGVGVYFGKYGTYVYMDESWKEFRCNQTVESSTILRFFSWDFIGGCRVERDEAPAPADGVATAGLSLAPPSRGWPRRIWRS